MLITKAALSVGETCYLKKKKIIKGFLLPMFMKKVTFLVLMQTQGRRKYVLKMVVTVESTIPMMI